MKDMPQLKYCCPKCGNKLLKKESETTPVFRRFVCLCGWKSRWEIKE